MDWIHVAYSKIHCYNMVLTVTNPAFPLKSKKFFWQTEHCKTVC